MCVGMWYRYVIGALSEERPWDPACLTACFPAVARAQEDPVFLPSPWRIIATLEPVEDRSETARADIQRTRYIRARLTRISRENNNDRISRKKRQDTCDRGIF